jgi:uncharacterized membrane protein YeaQ/YmgE (transglycosylase-associated protein family)
MWWAWLIVVVVGVVVGFMAGVLCERDRGIKLTEEIRRIK